MRPCVVLRTYTSLRLGQEVGNDACKKPTLILSLGLSPFTSLGLCRFCTLLCVLALPRQHAMAYQCLRTEHVLHGPRNVRYMPLCMFMSNRLVCLQVVMLIVTSWRSQVAPRLLGGGGQGLGSPGHPDWWLNGWN